MTTRKSMRDKDDLAGLIPALMRRARRLTNSPDEASDLVQDVVVKLLGQIWRGGHIDDLEPYAMTTLRHLAQKGWRRKGETEELHDDSAATLPDAHARLACKDLHAAIARLPAAQARLMRLVETGETSPARLAELTDTPVGTVMSRLARARVSLRAHMGITASAPVSSLYDDLHGI